MSFPSLNLCVLSVYLKTPLLILYPLQKLSMLSNRDSGSSLKIGDLIFHTRHKIWEDVAQGTMSAS